MAFPASLMIGYVFIPVILGVFLSLCNIAAADGTLQQLGTVHFWIETAILCAVLVGMFRVGERVLGSRAGGRASGAAAGTAAGAAALGGGFAATPAPGIAPAPVAQQPALATVRQDTKSWGPAEPLRPFLTFSHTLTASGIAADTLRILLCWSPYVVLLYPGIVAWDTGDQLGQYFGVPAFSMPAGQIWDHQPWFDTYLWGFFASAGHSLTGSYFLGLFVFCLIQLVLGAVGIAFALAYAARWSYDAVDAPRSRALHWATVFFAVFPLFPIGYMTILKDYTHMVFFLPWCVMFAELVRTRLAALRSPLFFTGFLALGVLMSLTKKTGMYVAVACLILLLFVRVGERVRERAGNAPSARGLCGRRLGAHASGGAEPIPVAATPARPIIAVISRTLVVAQIVLIWLLSSFLPAAVLFDPFHVVPSQSTFAMVVPMNQVARVAKDYPDDVSEQDKAAIESFIGYSWADLGKLYNANSSDSITVLAPRLDPQPSTSDFLKAWVHLGLKHPGTYVSSWLSQISGWGAFTANDFQTRDAGILPNTIIIRPYSELNGSTGGTLVTTEPHNTNASNGAVTFDNARNGLVFKVWSWLSGVPVMNALCYLATWTLIVPAFVLYAAWRRRREGDALVGEDDGGLGPQHPVRGLWYRLVLASPLVLSAASLFIYAVSGPYYPHYMFHTIVLGPIFLLLASARR